MPTSLPGIAGKDEFLGVLAHELRNPLSAIMGAIELIEVADLQKNEKMETCALLRRQVRTVARIVDDLTDIARIAKGKLTIHEEPVSVSSLMLEAIESVAPAVEVNSHELIVESAEMKDVYVRGDRVRLLQVFINLLTNAIKYTNPGGVIRFSCRSDGDFVRFEVRDNGIGIRPGNLPHIFEMFHQENRKNGCGLGIGLSLVKQIVDLHHGTVEAQSRGEGLGSSFLVTFPVFKMTHLPKPTPIQRNSEPAIIVMDDTPDVALPLANILNHFGYKAKAAMDGEEGIRLADLIKPDVAIIDIQMPNMGGIEVAERMRRTHPHCLLIAVTGYDDMNYLGHFHHQLPKPIDLKVLIEHISAFKS